MLKNLVRLEHKIGDRIYHLFCDPDSPTAEIKEVCTQFMARMVHIEQAAAESSKKIPEEVQVDEIN